MEAKNTVFINILKYFLLFCVMLAILWFALVLVEFYRVKTDRRPIGCFNMAKDIENNFEYSLTCYGVLYKYREYYAIDEETMTAKEFTLLFKDFKRILAEYEIR